MQVPPVAVVVIGRNERRNLDQCLDSVRAMDYPPERVEIIYVDSGSTDGSPELAERRGIRTIRLPEPSPTAARGREAGWRASSAPLILFVDGDCLVDPGFVRRALPAFQNPRVGMVFGMLREEYDSFPQYMLSLRYQGLRGGSTYLMGGNHLARREALEAAGGFDTAIESGENSDLGRRVRALGYEIQHVHVPAVLHNSKISGWRDWWWRAFRFGYGDLRYLASHPGVLREVREFPDLAPRTADAALFTLFLLVSVSSTIAWKWAAWPMAVGLLTLIIVAKACASRRKSDQPGLLLLYGLYTQVFAAAYLMGGACLVLDRLRGGTRVFDHRNRPRFQRRSRG